MTPGLAWVNIHGVARKHCLTQGTPGWKIWFLRQGKDLTQSALGELVFVSQPTVARWENNRLIPSIAQQNRLAEALGVTRRFLYDDDEVAA